MLSLNPSLYTAGFRPSLRAITDSIFGDVWHSSHGTNTNPSTPAAPRSPLPVERSRSPYAHSRSSSYSSVQSSLGQRAPLLNDLHIPTTMSPTLALARRSFHSPPTSPTHSRSQSLQSLKSLQSVSLHSPTSSISTVEAVNSWPSNRGIEYVRATVTLSPPPASRPRRPKPAPIAPPAQVKREKGLQPLWLESKARPSTPRKDKDEIKSKGNASPDSKAMRRESSIIPQTSETPTSPNGLRPLLLASKARPARSPEQRAREEMGLLPEDRVRRPTDRSGRSTWHAEPIPQIASPPPKALSFRERARRTIASVADIDWEGWAHSRPKSQASIKSSASIMSPRSPMRRPLLDIDESDVESA